MESKDQLDLKGQKEMMESKDQLGLKGQKEMTEFKDQLGRKEFKDQLDHPPFQSHFFLQYNPRYAAMD
jgi:hypothetical protein